jgi:hypothetical protein
MTRFKAKSRFCCGVAANTEAGNSAKNNTAVAKRLGEGFVIWGEYSNLTIQQSNNPLCRKDCLIAGLFDRCPFLFALPHRSRYVEI